MKDKSIEEMIEAEAKDYCDNTSGVSLYNHNTTKKAYIAGRTNGIEREKELFGYDTPFPLQEVLRHLSNAAKNLLHKKNYDGSDYEEIEICLKRAEEIQQLLK